MIIKPNILRAADALVTELTEEVVSTQPAVDKLKLVEPTRKPRIRPAPPARPIGHYVNSLLNRIPRTIPGHSTDAFAKPSEYAPGAIDRIKLQEPRVKPETGKPAFSHTVRPSNPNLPVRMGSGGPVEFKPKWSKPGALNVQLPGPGHPMTTSSKPVPEIKGKFNKHLKLKKVHGNSKKFKRKSPGWTPDVQDINVDKILTAKPQGTPSGLPDPYMSLFKHMDMPRPKLNLSFKPSAPRAKRPRKAAITPAE